MSQEELHPGLHCSVPVLWQLKWYTRFGVQNQSILPFFHITLPNIQLSITFWSFGNSLIYLDLIPTFTLQSFSWSQQAVWPASLSLTKFVLPQSRQLLWDTNLSVTLPLCSLWISWSKSWLVFQSHLANFSLHTLCSYRVLIDTTCSKQDAAHLGDNTGTSLPPQTLDTLMK